MYHGRRECGDGGGGRVNGESDGGRERKRTGQNYIQQFLNHFCYCKIATGPAGNKSKHFTYLLLYLITECL